MVEIFGLDCKKGRASINSLYSSFLVKRGTEKSINGSAKCNLLLKINLFQGRFQFPFIYNIVLMIVVLYNFRLLSVTISFKCHYMIHLQRIFMTEVMCKKGILHHAEHPISTQNRHCHLVIGLSFVYVPVFSRRSCPLWQSTNF